jgi:hypothetical protein
MLEILWETVGMWELGTMWEHVWERHSVVCCCDIDNEAKLNNPDEFEK